MHFSLLFEDRLVRANPAEVAALDFDRWTSEDRKQVVVVGLDLVLVHQTGGSLQGDESLRIATCSIHKFIHSGHFYSASSSPLPLRGAPDTARILRRSFKLQAIVSYELVQGLYVAARAGVEPKTLRTKGVVSTNAPQAPHTCGC